MNDPFAQSADAYSEIARMELKLASEATTKANFGTAETHRKNAAMAFEFEMKLRLSHGDASDTVKTSNQIFSGEDG